MKPYDLRVNGRRTPRELDDPVVRFAWRLSPGEHGVTVARHRVDLWRLGVTGEPDRMVWTSGDIASDDVAAVYTGDDLEPRAGYRWVVDITDTQGGCARAEAQFETGLRGTWSARWIGRPRGPWLDAEGERVDLGPVSQIERSWQTMYDQPPLQLRRAFHLDVVPVRARLYVSAHGVYRAYVNGQRAGADELTPGWTRYESRIEYQAYDVSNALSTGVNVLAAQVADGWWAGNIGFNTRRHADQYGDRPELIAELHLEFADGRHEIVSTDELWVERPGAIVVADLLMGEYHDALAATPGWLEPTFSADQWRPVQVSDQSSDLLVGQRADPVRVVDEIEPVSITRLEDGATLVDFGQNLTGRVRLTVRGLARGSIVELRHGEVLDRGRLYTDNLRSAEARDVLAASGTDGEVFEPLFTCHGFRYLEVRGLPGALTASDVIAVVMSSDASPAGELRTSNDLVNALYRNIQWSQRGNFVAVPTDCPQRDERLGWTADAQVFAPTAVLNSDIEAFLSRWLLDLNASQAPTGDVPDVAPVPPTATHFTHGAPGWGDAAVIVPWMLYRTYGDLDLLARQYAAMKAWVDYVAAVNPTTIWTQSLGNNHGDWLAPDAETPRLLVAAAYRIRSTDLLVAAARALDRDEDALHYAAEADRLRDMFRSQFVGSDGRVAGDTQTGYLFALAWDLVPDSQRTQLADHLVADILRRGRRLSTGFLGVGLLCPTLTRIGRPDLAYDILLQEEYPSWGYTINLGATTIWERWDGYTEHAGFQRKQMNSFNHYSLGSVGEWLYSGVAGIAQADDSIGFRRLRIAPQFSQRFTFVQASYESVRGRVAVAWRRSRSHYQLDVEIPPGTSADVVLAGVSRSIPCGSHSFTFTSNALPADLDPAHPGRGVGGSTPMTSGRDFSHA